MFCEKCGKEAKDDHAFCMNCGSKIEVFQHKDSGDKTVEKADNDNVLRCPDCRFKIVEGEKFCINCGTEIKPAVDEFVSNEKKENTLVCLLQDNIAKLFQSNKVTAFVAKYAVAFVLYFTIFFVPKNRRIR